MEDSDHQSGTLITPNAETMDHQSGAFIGSNEDLLTEILIRLPAASILRFKSVSKHWRLLLSHRRFIHRYDNINLSKSLGLFGRNLYVPFDVENPSPPPFRSIDFFFNRSNVVILQSCNGLLLCYACHNGVSEFYVFNPTTKQLAFIPPFPVGHTRFMALAFHQTHCVHYKVVLVCYLKRRKNMLQIQVYSSETRKWKICIESFSAHISTVNCPVYFNGAVYWAPEYRESSNFVCFKLDAEQLQMLPLPVEMMSYETRIMYFGESRGHLHLIFYTHGEEYMLHVNVYEMLTDRSGWFVKYRLQLDALLPDFPCLVYQYDQTPGYFGEHDFSVVDVVRGKEEEDTFLVPVTSQKLIRYNVHDKSYKELYDGRYCDLRPSCLHRYIDTLSSL